MRVSICYVAPYDPDYSRNRDTIRAFKRAGARVEVVRGPRESLFGSRRSRLGFAGFVMRSLISMAVRTLGVALRLLRCDVLVVGYFGQLDMLVLGRLGRAMGRPVIFSPLVTLTDTIIEDRRLASPGSRLATAVRHVDQQALRQATLVLVDTCENARFVRDLVGDSAPQVLELPVGVDENIFHTAPSDARAENEVLDVLFYGTFIPLHGIETIVRAAALLSRSESPVRIEFIGTGQDYGHARKLAGDLSVTNIIWRDWLPYSELGSRLREADIALGIFDGGLKASRVIPNKVHQALACGVPVVTRESPAISRLLVEGESALLVSPDDPEALAEAIKRLAHDPALRERIGAEGRDAWERYASEEQLARRAGQALRQLGIHA